LLFGKDVDYSTGGEEEDDDDVERWNIQYRDCESLFSMIS
jgi:hypothetical protein